MSNSISGAGMEGIYRGFQSMNQAAAKIAKAPVAVESPPVDTLKPVVELQQAKLQVQASAKVVDRENQVIGSLLDITV